MKRHPEYKYIIDRISEKDSWIFIRDKDQSGWGDSIFDAWDDSMDAGPVELLLRIKDRNHWDVEKVGMQQYRFRQDEIGMVFQWDDLFGLVIIIEDWDRLDEEESFLSDYFE